MFIDTKKKRTIKKAILFILTICLLAGTACGPSEEMKQEAKETKDLYSREFIEKVASEYGTDAKLKNIDCPIDMNIGSPVPDVTYEISKYLTGEIVIDGKSYDAKYDPSTKKLKDQVHTETILDSVVGTLPLDFSKILEKKYTDASYELPMFDSSTRNFRDATETSDNFVTISIITDEDLSHFKVSDFENLDALQQLKNSRLEITFRFVSLKNHDKLSELTGKIQVTSFSYRDCHPDVYVNAATGYLDAFEYYNIRNTLEITYDTEDNLKFVFND